MHTLWRLWRSWVARQIEDDEQVRMQFRVTNTAYVLSTLVALVQTVYYWQDVSKTISLLWLGTFSVLQFWRIASANQFRRDDPTPDRLLDWAALHVAQVGATQFVFGLSVWVFAVAGKPNSAVVTFQVLFGASIVVAILYSSFRPAFIAAWVCLAAPPISAWLVNRLHISGTFLALSLLLVAILAVQGRKQGRATLEVLRMRRENERLTYQLQLENTAKESALVRAQQADAAKTRFFTSISHDIRQPLFTLSLLTDAMAQSSHADIRRSQQTTMHGSISMLEGLFTQWLEASQLESGVQRPKMVAVDIEAFVGDMSAAFELRAKTQLLAFSATASPGWVLADPLWLQRVVMNLLDNALHYTHTGSITLSAVTQGQQAVFAVDDTGQGIASDLQEAVFDEFYRGNQSAQPVAGYGLGLPIVRRLLRGMGSDIALTSALGQGSRFYFTLPMLDAPEPVSRSPEPVFSSLQGLHVGLIENDAVVGKNLKLLLQSWGCAVQWASRASQALAWPDPPHALIADFELDASDAINGAELAWQLQQNWQAQHQRTAAVVMLSSQHLTVQQCKGFASLTKPIAASTLHAWLQQVAVQVMTAAQQGSATLLR